MRYEIKRDGGAYVVLRDGKPVALEFTHEDARRTVRKMQAEDAQTRLFDNEREG